MLSVSNYDEPISSLGVQSQGNGSLLEQRMWIKWDLSEGWPSNEEVGDGGEVE